MGALITYLAFAFVGTWIAACLWAVESATYDQPKRIAIAICACDLAPLVPVFATAWAWWYLWSTRQRSCQGED
jgi:hypothetical protein